MALGPPCLALQRLAVTLVPLSPFQRPTLRLRGHIKRKGAGPGKAAPFHRDAPRANGCAFARLRQSLNIKDDKTWSYYRCNPAGARGTTNRDAFTTFGTSRARPHLC